MKLTAGNQNLLTSVGDSFTLRIKFVNKKNLRRKGNKSIKSNFEVTNEVNANVKQYKLL